MQKVKRKVRNENVQLLLVNRAEVVPFGLLIFTLAKRDRQVYLSNITLVLNEHCSQIGFI